MTGLYRNRQGQRSWWLQPWAILAIVGAILIVAGLGVTFVGRSQSAALEARLSGLEQEADQAASRLAMARAEYEVKHALYADHWSVGVADGLREAERNLGEAGEVFALLDEAWQTQTGDRRQANELADSAESLLLAATSTVDAILGPVGTQGQGLYEILTRKGSEAEDLVVEAGSEIAQTRVTLDTKVQEAWNRSHGLSFASAYAKLAEAEGQLAAAQGTLATEIERGLVDLPLAYDQAQEARASARSAVDVAETEEGDARSAWASIEDARTRIESANGYILDSDYRRPEALAALLIAQATLTQAEQAFGVRDFETVARYVDQVLREAEEAWLMATTPAPEPTASATWSAGSGSDSDSWDMDESDSDSWDVDDSDSWDDWGSDSDSWDDGGSDSDSW